MGSGVSFTSRSGILIRDGKNPKSGFGMNIADHISESFETIFGVKNRYLNSLMRIRIREEKIQIRDLV
jgi:hypothetical protein